MLRAPHMNIDLRLDKVFLNKTPSTIYLKLTIIKGKDWNIVSDEGFDQTKPTNRMRNASIYKINETLSFSLKARSPMGWPKILIEVFKSDLNYKSSELIGYAVMTVPYSGGKTELSLPVFSPVSENVFGFKNFAAFKYKEFLLSSQDRFGIKCSTIGMLKLQLNLNTQEFKLFGLDL